MGGQESVAEALGRMAEGDRRFEPAPELRAR
jgi:hypothetical protein